MRTKAKRIQQGMILMTSPPHFPGFLDLKGELGDATVIKKMDRVLVENPDQAAKAGS